MNNIPASQAGSNDKSGTVQVRAANVPPHNMNIANMYGKVYDIITERHAVRARRRRGVWTADVTFPTLPLELSAGIIECGSCSAFVLPRAPSKPIEQVCYVSLITLELRLVVGARY